MKVGPWYIHWHHVPALDINTGASPKVGTQTLKKLLEDYQYYRVMVFEHPSYWIVREPVAKFKSLWRQKVRDGGNMMNSSMAAVVGASPDELMDIIESEKYKEAHWYSQAALCGPHADTIIPLEKFNEWWEAQGYGESVHCHTSSGDVDVSPELEERIRTYYAADVEMYEKAVREYES